MARLFAVHLALAAGLAAAPALAQQPHPPLPPPGRPAPPGAVAPPGAPEAPLPPGVVARPAPPSGYLIRLRDYEERRKLKKLTAIEEKEYEQLKAEQVRYQHELIENERKLEETRAARRLEAEKLALVAYPNLAANVLVRNEFAIHAYRVAVLERLKALAVSDGRSDLFVRIEGLNRRENERHEAWLLAHRGGR
jgi:hypothetical protein